MAEPVSVHILWIPLGAGEASPLVRWTGRAFERVWAAWQHRAPLDLYHSALVVRLDGIRLGIEMAPEWRSTAAGDVRQRGPVGVRALGRSRYFRYAVRCLADGAIPDRQFAVGGAINIETDAGRAQRLVDLPREFPPATWGRDEFGVGEMWNSNSLTSWLLAQSGHDVTAVPVPTGGRAPGWTAGIAVARGPHRDWRQQRPGRSA